MTFKEAVKSGFASELSKIAGFLRAGRRPFKASTLLKKTPSAPMSKGAEITKLSVDKSKLLRRAGWATVGALGYRQGKQAKEDYQTGRAMRRQQGY